MKRMNWLLFHLMAVLAFLMTLVFWKLNYGKGNEFFASILVFILTLGMLNGYMFSTHSDLIINIKILSIISCLSVYLIAIVISLKAGIGFLFYIFCLTSYVIYLIFVVGIMKIDKYPSVVRK